MSHLLSFHFSPFNESHISLRSRAELRFYRETLAFNFGW